MPLYSSARILVPVIILGNLLYNLTSLLDHEPPVRNSLTKYWTAMPFWHLSLLLCASLSTLYKFNSSYSESPNSLSIVFAQAESFGFLLFVFHRLRINLLSLLSLYQQAWPSSLPELSWTYYFIIVQCALVQFPSQQSWPSSLSGLYWTHLFIIVHLHSSPLNKPEIFIVRVGSSLFAAVAQFSKCRSSDENLETIN